MKRIVAVIIAIFFLVVQAYAKSPDRDISGFDLDTNKLITWCGIDFYFPSYFDTLSENSTDSWVTYYPEKEGYSAGLMFQSEEFTGTQESFDAAVPYIVKQTLDSGGAFANANIGKSEEILIAGLPGWIITFSGVATENDDVHATGSFSFVFNKNTGKIAMITCLYESNDQSRYDYLGDYAKMIETAELAGFGESLAGNTVKITYTDSVNVREKADAKSKKVGVVQPGQVFEYLETSDNGWYKIRLEDGTIGWVSGKMAVVVGAPNESSQADTDAEFLDLYAINETNSEKYDSRFVGKKFRITGIIGEAYGPSVDSNALITIHPAVMAKGMASMLPLDINVWLTPEEYKEIGGDQSVNKYVDLTAIMTSIGRNSISTNPNVFGYPIQLEFGNYK